MNKYALYAAGTGVVILAVAANAVPAYAQFTSSTSTVRHQQVDDSVISIPLTTHVRGDAGSTKQLESMSVKNGEYKVTVKAMNQRSTREGSDIIVRAGDSNVVVTNVESKAFQEKTASGTLIVKDGKVTVSVKFGKEKGFSGGVEVVLTEVVPEKPEQPEKPEKPETPEKPEKPEEKPAPKPEEPKVEGVTDEKPAELPKTGMGATVATTMAVSGIGYAVHYAYRRLNR